ncbi:MAG TPA: peptidoglycan editing factor PgeF [Planctomycetota bacterium]|jgi:hypothetical protein
METLTLDTPGIDTLAGVGPFWPLPALPAPFRAFFTTRLAGTSEGTYGSLNLALHVGDNPSRVRENRRLVFDAEKVDVNRVVVAQQVHGATAAVVTADDAGRGGFTHRDAIPSADAIVTSTANLPLMCLSADCLLLALADAQSRTLAVLHAGWRGMAAGVIENTISSMQKAGASPVNLQVVSGPSIGPCCFEVGADVVSALGSEHVVQQIGEKAMYDLRAAARARLLRCGVLGSQIELDTACTSCRADLLFSHRRAVRSGAKQTGRMGLVAWVK